MPGVRWVCGSLLSALLASGAGAQAASDPAAALDQAIAAAEARLQADDLPAADRHYRQALFLGWLLMGTLENGEGRAAEAREALANASREAAEERDALVTLAGAHLEAGDVDPAVTILTRLAGQDPRDVPVRRQLAKALAVGGQLELAVRRLEEAQATAPDDAELAFLLATDYLWLKRPDDAERLFARLRTRRPIAPTHVLIGRAYRDAGEYAKARAELQAAVTLDPAVRRAHYYLGMVWRADGAAGPDRHEKAIAAFQHELRLEPDDAHVSDQLGLALLEAGRHAEALPFLEAALRLEPRALHAYHLGRVQLALDRVGEAAATSRRALELAGQQGAPVAELERMHYQLGLALRKLGDGAQAATHFAEAKRLAARWTDPSRPGTTVSASYAGAPRVAAALVASLAAPSALSGLAPAERLELRRRARVALARSYLNLGVLQSRGERFAEAAERFEKAAAVDADFPDVQYSLGVARFNAGHFEKATEPLGRALAVRPQDTGIKRMLALAWLHTQAYDKAAALLADDPERDRDPALRSAYDLARRGAGQAAPAPVHADSPSPDGAESGSTREMEALLRERAANVNPLGLSMVVNDRRADLAARQLSRPLPLSQRLPLRAMAVTELIHSGRVAEALRALKALESDARQNQPEGWRQHERAARMLEVTAYMRMAEDQNCHRNNRDACLLPVRGEGVHQSREGSTRAIQVLERILGESPDDLRARWLINVAHMTLGTYPSGVPPRQLIPPAAFDSEYALPRFDNVAKEVGLDLLAHAGGALLEDFDNDGRLDVMTSSMGFEDQMRFFRNAGDGTFLDRTEAAGLMGELGGLNLLHADYDNDGFVDVVVLRGGWLGTEGRFPLSLLRNKGDGTFTDVTRAAGLLRFAPTQTAAWLDYDGDGRLDLFVGNESGPGDPHPCQLFHNDGDGTFSERAKEAGVGLVAFVKGVVSGDYDNDGRPDLYLSVLGEANRLFRNDGPGAPGSRGWRFTEVAAQAGVTEPKASFGTFFFDYDNDGALDLFVAGYGRPGGGLPVPEDVAADSLGLPTDAERGRLYRNRGDGTFEDVTRAAHLDRVVPAMGLNFGDLDNDGWLDFYAGTGTPDLGMLVPNRMFRNDGGRVFQDVTTAGNFGHLQKGHGVAFGDVDNDGDQDVFEEMGGAYLVDKAYSALYENPGNGNRWLTLELEGVRSNRKALGARIKVAVETPAGRRYLYRTVGSGGSFGGSPLRQEIGLGPALRVAWVEVLWPVTGAVQKVEGLRPGRHYLVREGTHDATELKRPRFSLARVRP